MPKSICTCCLCSRIRIKKDDLVKRYVKQRVSDAIFDATHTSDYESEFENLARQLANKMTIKELKSFVQNTNA